MSALKKAYEDWYRLTQPKDAGATQRIEQRRAFYSGVAAALVSGIVDTLESEAGYKAIIKELDEFFAAEEMDGYGIPKEPQ